MIRPTSLLIVCVVVSLSGSLLIAEERHEFGIGAYQAASLASMKGGYLGGGERTGAQLGEDTIGGGLAEPESYAESEADSFGLLADSYGATPGAFSSMPGMIGDFFGTGYRTRLPSFGQSGPNFADGTTVAITGGDRRFKISDNNSPFPVDRIVFNYHHFHNALVTGSGSDADLNRGSFAIEKTFFDDRWSVELRLPFSSGLNHTQRVDGVDNLATEFGNIGLATKRLVYQGDNAAASVGLGMIFPTAQDTSLVSAFNSNRVLTIENEAIYLQPFFGLFWAPSDRLFTQFFMQADFDTRGNSFSLNGEHFVLQDQTLLFVDFSAGYWVYRNPCRAWFTGLAPMIELHHATTLQDPDTTRGPLTPQGGDEITNFANRQDFLNLTGGLRFEFGGRTYLTVAGVAPLSTGDNKAFDAEFNAQLIRLY